MSLVKTNFIKPYPQAALGGEEGLTAHDVAKALSVPVERVLKKLRKRHWAKSPNWLAIPFGMANKTNGLTIPTYSLNTNAAKAFVAKWDNEIGAAYFDWLLACERVVLEKVPQILKQNEELKVLNATLEEKKFRDPRLKKPIRIFTKLCKDKSGEIVKGVKDKPMIAHSAEDKEKYKLQHSLKVLCGMSRRLNENQSEGIIESTKIALELVDVASKLLNHNVNKPALREVVTERVRFEVPRPALVS